MTAQPAIHRTQEQPQRLSEPAGQHVSMHARNKLNSACPVTPEGGRGTIAARQIDPICAPQLITAGAVLAVHQAVI